MVIDKSQRFITLVRLGYAARGVTYILLGILALGASGREEAGAEGAFEYLQDMPAGSALLWFVALGMLAYALFKLLSGISNLHNHPADAKGVAHRIGEIGSGVAHLFLAYAAYKFASGIESSAAAGSGGQAMVGPVMDFTLGPIVIGVIGLGMLAAAAVQGKRAATGEFMQHIAGHAPRAVEGVGRAGHAARAIVFAIIGWSLVKAAWLASESTAKGLGEALVTLRDNGPAYTLVAIGLMLFGAFSLVTARYRIIPDFDRSRLAPDLPR